MVFSFFQPWGLVEFVVLVKFQLRHVRSVRGLALALGAHGQCGLAWSPRAPSTWCQPTLDQEFSLLSRSA